MRVVPHADVAEVVARACDATGRERVMASLLLDPSARQVLDAHAEERGGWVNLLPYDRRTGRTYPLDYDDDVAAIVVQQPNALGIVEDLQAHAGTAGEAGAELVVMSGRGTGPADPAREAARVLTAIEGVELAVTGPFAGAFPLRVDVPDPGELVRRLNAGGHRVGPVVDGFVVVTGPGRADVAGLAEALAAAVRQCR